MSGTQDDYRSYLLRLYRVRTGKETLWRASLQSTQGGRWYHFASLRELVDILEQEDGLVESIGEEENEMDNG